MAIIEINKIFLGNTPSEQRKFLFKVLEVLRGKGYENIIVPAVGQFAIPHIAISAGYEKERILSSDISYFSSLLGYYYTQQPIESLKAVYDNEILIDMDYEAVNLMFLSNQKKAFDDVVNMVTADIVHVADLECFEAFKEALKIVSVKEDIRNLTPMVYKMCQIVIEYYSGKEK